MIFRRKHEPSDFAAEIDAHLRHEILSYALAGHPPALLLPEPDGQVVALDQRGLFLGFMPSAHYATVTVPIGSGARLIVYSDGGVTETPAPDDDLFGIDRLSAFAARERHIGRPTHLRMR
jgi:serine phosphatase RsbU (regulator of sigma subunit)